jgi:DnaB-like helicase C terminal domain
VIHDGSITTAVNARITIDFFTDDKYQRVWEYVLDHWAKYGISPDEAVMKLAFPSYQWKDYPQPIDYFIDGLRQRRKKAILVDALQQSSTFLQTPDDPTAMDQMEQMLREAVWQVRLETAPTLDLDYTDQAISTQAETDIDERMLDPGFLRGISTGFDGIDYVTGGFQPEQFIVMIGLPKSLKSSTLLYMALACHRRGKVPLFIGFEMSDIEQRDRLLSLLSGVSLTKIITGALTVREQREVLRPLRQMQGSRPFIVSTDIDSATTVSGIQAKIMEYIPDVVFIDGAYLMLSEQPKIEQGSARAFTDIARSLKKLAQNLKVPIVVTTAASMTRARGGQLNPYSAMYTQAWQQSADVMLGVERVDPEDYKGNEVLIKMQVLHSRGGPRADTMVMWDWTRGKCSELTAQARTGTDDDED